MNHLIKESKPDLFIAQPLIASYRIPLFTDLAKAYQLVIVSSPAHADDGFGTHSPSGMTISDHKTLSIGPFFHYQCGIISHLARHRPGIFLFAANPRNLAIWPALLLCRLLGIHSFAHGQGAFNKPNPGGGTRALYRMLAFLSTRYICYTDVSQQKMLAMGCPPGKLRVARNTLVNSHPLPPDEKEFQQPGILFIGRLREGCGLELLLQAFTALKAQYPELALHIIGDGPLAETCQSMAAGAIDVRFYGMVNDNARINAISRHCILGVYPGNAGLSIVHYMSLSLPVIVHNDLDSHMGPEPSYVSNDYNGLTFNKESVDDLIHTLHHALSDPAHLRKMAENAYQTYQSLNHPGLAQRFIAIFNEAGHT